MTEMWKVQVCPMTAGQMTGIFANIDAVARQPGFPHLAVLLSLLTSGGHLRFITNDGLGSHRDASENCSQSQREYSRA
jgi:hypothetical protein